MCYDGRVEWLWYRTSVPTNLKYLLSDPLQTISPKPSYWAFFHVLLGYPMSPLMGNLFKFFVIFFMFISFFLLNRKNYLLYINTSPSIDVCIANIFSQWVACLFFLVSSFKIQNFKNLT